MSSSADTGVTADGLKAGDVLKNTYRIIRFLGEGGAGAVYVGEHTGLGNTVAIKTLFGKFVRDESMRRRFVEEGVIQANLNHRNIVRVTDIVDEPRLCAIIMEYVEGSSLDRFIRKAPDPPNVELMTGIFLQILDGMGHAHSHGIVHRDLKPANILLGGTDAVPVPKIADFGIAKVVSDFTRTETGTAMGTIYYASPEQLTNAKAVDHRADVYSLACTYYEMLTRQLPFSGDSLYGIMRAHIQSPRPDASALNPNISRALSNCIKRAMATDPEHRHDGCEAFARDIRSVMTGQPAAPAPAPLSVAPAATVIRPPPAAPAEPPPEAAPAPAAPDANTRRPTRPTPSPTTSTRAPTTVRPTAPSTATSRVARTTQAGTTSVTRPPAETHTAGLIVKGAIGVLSLLVVGLIVVAATRDRDENPAPSPVSPSVDPTPEVVTEATGATPTEATGTPAAPDAAAAQAPPTLTLAYCRDLSTRYQNFDPFGNTPIGQAIAELERDQDGCSRVLTDESGDTTYEQLTATLSAIQTRITLYDLRAMRAGAGADGAGEACTEAVLAATEASRALRTIADAESAGRLMDYEISSLASRRQDALAAHARITVRHPDCTIQPLAPDLLPEDPAAADAKPGADEAPVNPQIVDVQVRTGAPDLVGIGTNP